MNNFVAYDLKILFDKELFELSPSSADNRPLYSVPLYMNHGVHKHFFFAINDEL